MEGLSTTELFQIVMSNQVVLMTALLNTGMFKDKDKAYVQNMLNYNAELLAPEATKLMRLASVEPA